MASTPTKISQEVKKLLEDQGHEVRQIFSARGGLSRVEFAPKWQVDLKVIGRLETSIACDHSVYDGYEPLAIFLKKSRKHGFHLDHEMKIISSKGA